MLNSSLWYKLCKKIIQKDVGTAPSPSDLVYPTGILNIELAYRHSRDNEAYLDTDISYLAYSSSST